MSRLGLVSRKIVTVSVLEGRRLGLVSVLAISSRAQDVQFNSFLMGMQMAPYAA